MGRLASLERFSPNGHGFDLDLVGLHCLEDKEIKITERVQMNDKQIEHLAKVRELAREINATKRQLSSKQNEIAQAFIFGSKIGISGADLSRAADVSRQRVSQILHQPSQMH